MPLEFSSPHHDDAILAVLWIDDPAVKLPIACVARWLQSARPVLVARDFSVRLNEFVAHASMEAGRRVAVKLLVPT